ncbi:hypothetical protein F7731_15010 [Cytobacillus depressus]|uniref:Uncharacterized protein n=1 Tax=Cytobacillus depressus TaxID=1602942 RepID=A0A6L3V3H9_9BACI|nr:hypothetical protein [Cytobacillus depressus]KAB2334516.1 hypothetical protein F7731_15010 [Cytobacillus depressus]
MFHNNYKSKQNSRAEILMAGQALSFKLDESETVTLMEKLEEVSYDFKKLDAIKLFHPDGRLKSIINPLQISRIWFS